VGARNDNNKDGRIPRTPVTIARLAVEQLSEITGRQPDTISGLERTDDGWLLKIEVVELERIPDSTSLMATYEMELDERGQMRSYRRLNRYYRNQAGDS
jgi:hypothetical protein